MHEVPMQFANEARPKGPGGITRLGSGLGIHGPHRKSLNTLWDNEVGDLVFFIAWGAAVNSTDRSLFRRSLY
jgi:hypothetical protein